MSDSARPVEAPEGLVDRIRFDERGLIPVIAQDIETKDVLMLAWMDREAIRRTLSEGRVTYFSRSRKEYWRKGDTSGNTQHAVRVELDCDSDALLIHVHQHGPACHTGARRCFDGGSR